MRKSEISEIDDIIKVIPYEERYALDFLRLNRKEFKESFRLNNSRR